MNKKWNINVMLCRKADEEVSNIENIFDKLVIKKNRGADFTIVTVTSSICADEERFGLFYFIEYFDKDNERNKFLYLCSSIYGKDEQRTELSSVEGASNGISQIRIRGCKFPNEGNYEIKVYKYDDDELSENYNKQAKEMLKYAEESHLVSVYSFKVEYE